MRRIVRDTWAWRGGFAADELHYEPVLADATAGPITAPAEVDWPVLTSQLEAAWSIPGAERLGILALAGPAAAHLALVGRAGGVHATVPRDERETLLDFEAIRGGDDDVPAWEESLALLESAGVVERTASRIAVLRPEPPSVARMRLMRDALDDHEHRAPDEPVTNRLLRAVWRQTYSGLGVGRFRELAANGRLCVTVTDPAPGDPALDPFFEVGQASLPDYRNAPGAVLDYAFPERSWVTLAQIAPGCGSGRTPLWGTAPEVLAVLLGAGRGSNAVRRALRATMLWLFLADHAGGCVGAVEMSISTISRALAEVLGLKADADHRKLSRLLLADLERAALVTVESGSPQRIVLRTVPAPDDATVRHALGQWMSWRVAAPEDEPLERMLRLTGRHRERYVRGPWADALEARRVTAEVLPGARGGVGAAGRPQAVGVGTTDGQ